MSSYRFAARLPDGSVRGFVGRGDGEGAAYRDCLKRRSEAVQALGGDPADIRGIVWDGTQLTDEQWATVVRDWQNAAV